MKKLAAICLLFVLALPARAVEDGQVMYAGGTVPALQAGALGHLNYTSESDLAFEFAANKLLIPYAKIDSFQYTEEVARHLGVLPAMAVGLIRKRQRRHFVRINFRDENNKSQVAVFEVSKRTPQTLLPVLQLRSPQACKPAITAGWDSRYVCPKPRPATTESANAW